MASLQVVFGLIEKHGWAAAFAGLLFAVYMGWLPDRHMAAVEAHDTKTVDALQKLVFVEQAQCVRLSVLVKMTDKDCFIQITQPPKVGSVMGTRG